VQRQSSWRSGRRGAHAARSRRCRAHDAGSPVQGAYRTVSAGGLAAGVWPPGSGRAQGAEALDLPPTLVNAARLALHPGLGARAYIARQEVAAGEAVLGIGFGNRGHGTTRPRVWGLPWQAPPVI